MKKILFNDRYLLTKAVLEGRKIQTRRLVPKEFFSLTWDVREDTLVYENDFGEFIDIRDSKYAMYKKGEIVAVAQSYKDVHEEIEHETLEMLDLFYSNGWKNKMFTRADLMPHQIQITNVRIERLQDISDDDCIKEGIEKFDTFGEPASYIFFDSKTNKILPKGWCTSPREAYADLIDRVGKKGTFDSNPYVFVYDFKLIK